MLGTYTVKDSHDRELSETDSLSAARYACRIHLMSDGEEPPLTIVAPDGFEVETATLDSCGRFLIRGSSLSRRYEQVEGVVGKWGVPEKP